MTLDEMLDHVKRHTIRLLDFCTVDFGFRQEQIEVVFSGGRGYHVHIEDAKYQVLDSFCRREIAIYMANQDLALDKNTMLEVQEKRLAPNLKTKIKRIPNSRSPGWRGRFTRALLAGLERGGYAFDLAGIGTKKREALEAIRQDPQAMAEVRDGNLIRFREPEIQALMILGKAEALDQRADLDAPVTADIKRLIRLPGSLHGKTGLTTMVVPVRDLEAFDPLTGAVHLDELNLMFDLVGIRDGQFRLKDRTWAVKKDQVVRWPAHSAYFALGRKFVRSP